MIIYAVICRSHDAVVLVENSATNLGGNAPQVTLGLIERLRDHPEFLPGEERKTFAQRNEEAAGDFFRDIFEACTGGVDNTEGSMEHFFHVWNSKGVFYTCLSDDPDVRSHQVAFSFLQHVKDEFTTLYKERRIQKANAYGLEKDFSPNLRSAMHYYNINSERLRRDAKVDELRTQVDHIKNVMGGNINLLLQRGENLEKMVNKSDRLSRDSLVFKKRSNDLKVTMRDKYYRWSIGCGFAALVFIWFCVILACGFTFNRCRVKS